MRAPPADTGGITIKITVKIMGIPGLQSGKHEVDRDGNTLSDVADHFARDDAKFRSMKDGLLWFVNSKAVGREWKEVSLGGGDSVIIAVPIAGG